MTIDIRTQPGDNDGYAVTAAAGHPDTVLFTYLDTYADEPTPVYLTGVLFPTGIDNEPTFCESDHDVPADHPVVVVADYSTVILCPDHFRGPAPA